MDNRKFRLIASLESAKEAWDTLQEIFEGPRSRDLKKEADNRILKRFLSQFSSNKDQEIISRHRVLTSIVIKEKALQQ